MSQITRNLLTASMLIDDIGPVCVHMSLSIYIIYIFNICFCYPTINTLVPGIRCGELGCHACPAPSKSL